MLRRILLLSFGSLALALGAVGIVLPMLPTTPFVLCAAGCYATASPKLYQWLARTRYFGEYIQNYKNKTGISGKARATGLVFLWATLIISALFIQKPLVIGILAVVGAAVSVHILTIRSSRAAKKLLAATKSEMPLE